MNDKSNVNSREVRHGIQQFFNYIRHKFDLDHDKAQQDEVVESISRGVEFTGSNLWVLIFATLIASLGLNINSAPVIIGAMLISPLMGPIMGIGLALGINNFELLKRAFRNFLLMVIVSIIASTIFFWISPLSEAKSELLARTSPTVYDVLIAFFGGLAGIVAQSRRDRSITVIPGVAIATALMPPLCTAGYGLATGQFTEFFIGAFYLFFINTVFIAIATYIMVRFLKYDKKVFLDKARERRVKNYMIVIIVLTLTPSVFMAYNIVQETIFENAADKYVKNLFRNYDDTQVISYTKDYRTRREPSHIEVVLIGEPLSTAVIDNAMAQREAYGLADCEVVVRQTNKDDQIDVSTLSTSYVHLLDEKNRKIEELEMRVAGFGEPLQMDDISREAATVVDNIARIAVSRQVAYDMKGLPVDTMLMGVVSPVDAKREIDVERLSKWLAARAHNDKVRIYVEKE